MKNKEEKKMKENKNKSESALVTKESFSAAFMLFSVLALLMLCTGSLIFGEVGSAIQAFLLSMFGYFAYPLFIGASYLFFMMLLEKRLVKNRKAGFVFATALIFAALIVHTAVTYAWPMDGYAEACFNAGENFTTATVTGWVGALIVMAVSSLISKVGAIVTFSLLCALSIYLFIVFVGKKSTEAKVKAPKKKKVKIASSGTNIAQEVAPANGQAGNYAGGENVQRMVRYEQTPAQNQYGDMRYAQRPGVRLSEGGTNSNINSDTYSFSPFGANSQETNNNRSLERSYENAREFLFGTGATESYKQNLIFDPNANVNNLPPVEPIQPTPSNSTYVPSYTEHYQDSFNHADTETRPTKIVTDTTYGSYLHTEEPLGQNADAQEPIQNNQPQEFIDGYEEKENAFKKTENIKPLQEIAPQETVSPYYEAPRSEYLDVKKEEPTSEPSFGRESVDSIANDSLGTETRRGDTEESGYRRHDYMDLFAVDNPQELNHDDLFGRESRIVEPKEETPTEDFSFDRGSNRGFLETPSIEEEPANDRGRGRRDGLNLFDEETDDAYTLRSDFEESSRGFEEPPLTTSRDVGDRARRFDNADVSLDRGRAFEESPADLPPPIVQEKPIKVEPAKPTPPPKPRIPKPYVRMSLDDLDCRDVEPTQNHEEVENAKATIIATLEEFKVSGATIASVTFGPTVTRYNVTLPRGIMPAKVVALDQSISMNLYSEGVSIYPNFRDGVVSVEVPNTERQFVQLGSMLSGDTFVNAKPSSLMFAMGKDVANKKVYGDISKMIHLLVAGASGSGKSVFLGALIISLIYKYSPEELRLILIDPKKTEFVLYNDLPHLMINEIITDANKAVQSLNWAIDEMNRRYGLFQEMSNSGTYVVNLDQYNEKLEKAQRLPKIVIIIDELADLMLAAKKDMEEKIQNLTQKARAAGIHLIVATQRPSTDVITGVIKSNLPTRIAFGVATDVDSRVILDQTGAQKLLGKGDFLYTMQGLNSPVRVQSAFISPEESQKVVNFIKENNEAYYDEAATAYINNAKGGGSGDSSSRMDKDNVEPVYIDALRYVIISGSASISMIQRKCSAGYNKAGKIIEWMEEMGYISPFDGAKARKVLLSKEEFESKYGPL